jgi:hypothetical protein
MVDSFDKWPAEVEIHKVVSSDIDSRMDLFFVTGIMNEKQYDTLKARMPILSDFEVGKDRWVISTLLSLQQLKAAYDKFTNLSKEWRGQYYVITNKFVDACKPYIN